MIASGRRLRLAHLVVWTGWFIGKAACCLGDYGRAIGQLTEAADICDRIGDRAWNSRLLNTLGWCYGEIGSHEHAREFNRRAAVIARAIGDPEIVANSEINLALDALALDDVAAAQVHLEPIRAGLERPGDPWMRWRYSLHAFDALGRVALRTGAPEQALALADEEAAGARRHDVRKIEARALVLRGEALATLERHEDAAAVLRDALRIADEIGYPRAAWEACAHLAAIERRAGRSDEAGRHLARRRAIVVVAGQSLTDTDLRRRLEATIA